MVAISQVPFRSHWWLGQCYGAGSAAIDQGRLFGIHNSWRCSRRSTSVAHRLHRPSRLMRDNRFVRKHLLGLVVGLKGVLPHQRIRDDVHLALCSTRGVVVGRYSCKVGTTCDQFIFDRTWRPKVIVPFSRTGRGRYAALPCRLICATCRCPIEI